MKQVGYGVLNDGKPAGIWPIGFRHAKDTAKKYKGKSPMAVVEVVPVFIGTPVDITEHPPITEKEIA